MRKNTLKRIAWIKMPIDLLDYEPVAELFAQKGAVGLGVYLSLIHLIYRREEKRISLAQAINFRIKGVQKTTLMKVINDFGLFFIDEDSFIYSSIDFLDLNRNSHRTVPARPMAIRCPTTEASVEPPTRTRVREIEKEEEREIKKESEIMTSDDAADMTEKTADMTADEAMTDDVRRDLIRRLPLHSAWAEATLMKSDFGELIARNWDYALELFVQHITAHCKETAILTENDARRYFLNFVTHSRTSAELRRLLELHEHPLDADNPYRFEDPGSTARCRHYLGIPLPDDAPPRPNDRSIWDSELATWLE